MFNSAQWEVIFGQYPKEKVQELVERSVRSYLTLADIPPDKPISSSQLATEIGMVAGQIPNAVKSAFFALAFNLARTGLSDCAKRDIPRESVIFGDKRIVRPWVWHRPDGDKPAWSPTSSPPPSKTAIMRKRIADLEETVAALKDAIQGRPADTSG